MSYSFFPLQNVTLIVGPTVTSPSVGMRSWIPTLKCRNSSTPTLGVSAATKYLSLFNSSKLLTEKNMYLPQRDQEGHIFVSIEKELVFVKNNQSKAPISEVWHDFL